MLHHILLEVVAEYRGFHAALDGEVIVENEREVGFAAAEIEYAYLVQIRAAKLVVNKLHKAVYLLILIVL